MPHNTRESAAALESLGRPEVHDKTLGYRAIVFSNLMDDGQIFSIRGIGLRKKASRFKEQALAFAIEEFGGSLDPEEALVLELKATRKKLQEIDPVTKPKLERYLTGPAAEALCRIKRDETVVNDWTDWLSNKATNDQLHGFLRWHVSKIEHQQISPKTDKLIEKERTDYKNAISAAIDKGLLPLEAEKAVYNADNIKVYLGDVFDTILQERGGYHLRGTDKLVIGISQDSGNINQKTLKHSLDWAAFHEFNHAVLGRLPYRWLNEALTEHIAQFLKHGQPDAINPYTRYQRNFSEVTVEERGSYIAERGFVADLLTRGVKVVPVSELVKAYVDRSYQHQMASLIDQAWAPYTKDPNKHALSYVNEYIEAREEEYIEEGLTETQAQTAAVRAAHAQLIDNPNVIFS